MHDPAGVLVSVIIPAYNAAEFLPETLRSACRQSYAYIEIIVVDDGSTDNTADIVSAAAAADSRIRLIRQANAGVAAARNTAIEAARGELIAPLDADDLWHPDYLTLLVAALETSGPQTVLAYAWFALIDKSGSMLGLSRECALSQRSEVFRELIRGNFIGNGSSVVMRRNAVRAAGGYDPTLLGRGGQGCEDLAIYLALAERGDFAISPQHLVGYRQHRESMSRDEMQMLRSRLLVLADLSRRRPDLPNSWFAAAIAFCCAANFWKTLVKGRLSEALSCLNQAAHEGLLCLTCAIVIFIPQQLISLPLRALKKRTRLLMMMIDHNTTIRQSNFDQLRQQFETSGLPANLRMSTER